MRAKLIGINTCDVICSQLRVSSPKAFKSVVFVYISRDRIIFVVDPDEKILDDCDAMLKSCVILQRAATRSK